MYSISLLIIIGRESFWVHLSFFLVSIIIYLLDNCPKMAQLEFEYLYNNTFNIIARRAEEEEEGFLKSSCSVLFLYWLPWLLLLLFVVLSARAKSVSICLSVSLPSFLPGAAGRLSDSLNQLLLLLPGSGCW